MNLKELFPQRLKAARALRGMTQQELKKESGWISIEHFECGDRLPSAESIVRIAKALSVSADFLLGITESMDYRNDGLHDRLNNLTNEQLSTIQCLVQHWTQGRA